MNDFSSRLITWQKIHGRHDLPWQNTSDPYAIWVSEIMLQQTQVAAVIGYYQRFMASFPNIETLANATQDEVLQHWSGLGYYSRARNLHNAAQKIVDDFNGIFPQDFSSILSLPGIGRSTAAAISTFAFNIPQPILDGNVKRVFARHFLVEGWPSLPKVEAKLWKLAEQHMPQENIVAYTQGLMDLGATLCTRRKYDCKACPVKATCGAYEQNSVAILPSPKPRKAIPQKEVTMLILLNGKEVMLEKRAPTGIWGGLWSLPEIDMQEIASEIALARFGAKVEAEEPLEIIHHAFTHFKLAITPQPLQLIKQSLQTNIPNTIWLTIDEAISAAIPTPIRKILLSLKSKIDENGLKAYD